MLRNNCQQNCSPNRHTLSGSSLGGHSNSIDSDFSPWLQPAARQQVARLERVSLVVAVVGREGENCARRPSATDRKACCVSGRVWPPACIKCTTCETLTGVQLAALGQCWLARNCAHSSECTGQTGRPLPACLGALAWSRPSEIRFPLLSDVYLAAAIWLAGRELAGSAGVWLADELTGRGCRSWVVAAIRQSRRQEQTKAVRLKLRVSSPELLA